MKLLTAAALALGVLSTSACAATYNIQQNQWIIIENAGDVTINPVSLDGSFSYTYATSKERCTNGGEWTCIPGGTVMSIVQDGYNNSFAYGWGPTYMHSQTASNTIDGAGGYVYVRVDSGSGTVETPDLPAVPLPLPALALVSALALFWRFKK